MPAFLISAMPCLLIVIVPQFFPHFLLRDLFEGISQGIIRSVVTAPVGEDCIYLLITHNSILYLCAGVFSIESGVAEEKN